MISLLILIAIYIFIELYQTFKFKMQLVEIYASNARLEMINGVSRNLDKKDRYSGQLKKTGGVQIKLDRNVKYSWSYTGQQGNDYTQFAPAINMTEFTKFMDLIAIFKKTCEEFNINYMLQWGSVLGAYRHHGFIPWDDDFDCMVNISQKHSLKKALTEISDHTFTVQTIVWNAITVLC